MAGISAAKREWFFRKRSNRKGKLWCFYCGEPVSRELDPNDPKRATIDHLVPKSKGGRDHPKNLVVACLECNQFKADRLLRGIAGISVG